MTERPGPPPPKGFVITANLTAGNVSASTNTSERNMRAFDDYGARRIAGFIENHCASGRIVDGRNDVVNTFLQHDYAEWLLWFDDDMGWEKDALEQLIHVADRTERPIVGGLCFGMKLIRVAADGSREFESFPTIYRQIGEKFQPWYDYQKNTLIQCDGTGSAFLLVHRDVFVKIRDEQLGGRPLWYKQIETSDPAAPLGEDLSFCVRAREAGFPVHVHSGIRTSHKKDVYLNEDFYDRERANPRKQKTYVVIPVKNNLSMTQDLLRQLQEQGGYDEILVFDNGSERKTKNWLGTQPGLTVFDCPDASIHDMWNAGAEYAIDKDPAANVVFLNNDLRIGDNFLEGLTHALRVDQKVVAACPNYDGRPGEGFEQVFGICAGRYDGTGGLAGFAFAVRGEFFSQHGYRFPDEAKWWFGDNDLCLSIYEQQGVTILAREVTCEHLDGGSNTIRTREEDEEFRAQIGRDQEWFERTWDPETGLRRTREFVLQGADDGPAG